VRLLLSHLLLALLLLLHLLGCWALLLTPLLLLAVGAGFWAQHLRGLVPQAKAWRNWALPLLHWSQLLPPLPLPPMLLLLGLQPGA
jgi:hypothetical protein